MSQKIKPDLLNTLSLIDVTGLDADILLFCYQHLGGVFSHQVVEETGAHRGMVDRTLERLQKNGYLKTVPSGKRVKFLGENPKVIEKALRDKSSNFKDAAENYKGDIKAYKASKNTQEPDIGVVSYRGKDGLQTAHMDRILRYDKVGKSVSRQICRIGYNTFIQSTNETYKETYLKLIEDYKISSRAIIPETAKSKVAPTSILWEENKKLDRLIKYVAPSDVPQNVDILIYADSIAFQYQADDINVVIIRNQDLSNLARFLFENLWNTSS